MAKVAYQKNMPRKAQGVSTRGSSLNAEAIRLKEMDREPKKKQIHQDLEAARRRDDNLDEVKRLRMATIRGERELKLANLDEQLENKKRCEISRVFHRIF
jgi:hypothetical protein